MKKIYFLIFSTLLLIVQMAEAKKTPKHLKNAGPTNCKVLADSSQKLYEAGDPSYLTWDISPKCDPAQLYQAYYYQGLGFYILPAWKESLYFLTMAKEIGGPKDEEILFYLWNVNKKLDRFQEMERATHELHRRYPNSFFLLEILDEWKTVKHPTQGWNYGYSSRFSTSSNNYLKNVFTNRLRASTGQRHGPHSLRETGSLTIKNKIDTHVFQGFQLDLGSDYQYKGISAELDYGAGYDARNSSDPLVWIHGGTVGKLVDSNWNWQQGRASIGYSYTTKGGWNLGANLNAFQLSKDWLGLGINHTEVLLFPTWMIIGSIDYQKNWIHLLLNPNDTTLFKTVALDGMQTLMLNLTPFISVDRHSFGLGATYYLANSHYGAPNGIWDETDIDHSITSTASYTFELRNWIKFNFSASAGLEFNPYKKQDPLKLFGVKPGALYGAEAGLSVAF